MRRPAPANANVFTHTKDSFIAGHLFSQPFAQSFGNGPSRHIFSLPYT